MNTLSNLELLTVLSFGIPFLFIALAVIFYIMSLKSDNAYLRNCLDKNRAQRQTDRERSRDEINLQRSQIKRLENRNSELRKEIESINPTNEPRPEIHTGKIISLQYRLKEFRTETEASKKTGLNRLYATIGEQVYKSAKVVRFQEYETFNWINEIEIKVLDLKD